MQYCNCICLIFIIFCLSVSEVYTLRKNLHNHDVDEAPIEIEHQEHKLGKSLSLRTDDLMTEKDSVVNIRKGAHLTLNSDDRR